MNQTENNRQMNGEAAGKGVRNRADSALFWAGLLFLGVTYLEYLAVGRWITPDAVAAAMLMVLKGTLAAALIGGLADWYGVTSIFGKPLHIPFMTEIAIKRKDGFIESIKDFIGDDILSDQNVRAGLIRLDLSETAFRLLEEEREKEEGLISILSDSLAQVVFEILKKVDPSRLDGILKQGLLRELEGRRPSAIGLKILNGLVNEKHFERIVSKLAGELETVMELESVRKIIDHGIDMAIMNYAEKGKGRGIIAETMKSRLKSAVYEGMRKKLLDAKDLDPNTLALLRDFANELVRDLEGNKSFQRRMDQSIEDFIKQNKLVEERWSGLLSGIERMEDQGIRKTGELLDGWIRKIIDGLLKDAMLMDLLEKKSEQILVELLREKRPAIKELVERNLRVMPEDELILLLRTNSEHELQYIRLNGMLFGTIIGLMASLLKLAF